MTSAPNGDTGITAVAAAAARSLPDDRLPLRARDGDCVRWAPLVTRTLEAGGILAETVTLVGWLDDDQNRIGFLHQVTVTADLIVVDYTAQAFGQWLPRRWVAPFDVYTRTLAERAGVRKVTTFDGR